MFSLELLLRDQAHNQDPANGSDPVVIICIGYSQTGNHRKRPFENSLPNSGGERAEWCGNLRPFQALLHCSAFKQLTHWTLIPYRSGVTLKTECNQFQGAN
ncbi:unnamed protein product [Pleuronectes platessa]|uniref:Uncharacterized protein n=1 Tax=Pleuronectes platessa TaxID=8262 RepID=A0A9N7TU44_PLEPL|nr:unnamed protein product [Pleuronectes platessa]